MQNPFLEFYRAGLRSTADATGAYVERCVRLQERQLDLLNSQVQGATRFWAEVWRAAGEAQRTLMGPMQGEEPAAQAPQAEDAQPEEEAVQDPTELAAAQLSRAVGQARRRAAG